ncbi:TRAP transporter large permease [Halalkalibacterium halodurans]|jgi:tripartite ATP-independent transporter DctM subunit|uniref:C4-dicarboxylate transport system (Permease large protein) n=1 Tax=Halalkalibacterium halodurans (strain ATCC BAA-125 / DSM 18197 / FERM 7344 / JCM 9153 / C-125) TaxID=272558 RepID=Q9KEZ6_HALH5|nr:TRAP transporter large permease [Halalkalibacterium halodurans]MDY7221194.1 TRAP transporter large permease [Halalkalibacterium halodurans]MDY7240433.1 TRAP transporter large permease [Halalkalibacterium halodurans]MED4080329.1 TRAP transporter large permease [Halalkalibacterium halodurans]MED4084607.1 TRAP transporter large permease [Halalkalibacterium halodurans]MED4104829.1 TRAP transporter large permease [Halalkalibacterium halodurans]
MELATQAAFLLFGVFFLLLAIGVPISISIGLASLGAVILVMPLETIVFTAAQRMVGGINSFALLAVIFFILSGSIMNNGGIALRLINLAKLIAGRLPGSLAHTNVVGNMLFGSISGSAVASAAAIGSVMAPLQAKEGYNKAYSAAVNIASAPVGLLIPPSGVLIIYSLVSGGTSISALFMAGYLPGILMGLAVMVVAFFMAKKNDYTVSEKVSGKEAIKIIWQAIPSLLLVVVVIGGIVGGVFTATEGAAVAVLYSLALSLIYRSLTWAHFPKILKETIVMTGIVLFLVGASSIMSWAMAVTGLPAAISQAILSISDHTVVVLLIMMLTLLVIGTFMDLTPAVLIFTPIFLPIALQMGIDPVHFGIMLVFNLAIGIMTPPVGSCLFVGCSVGNVSIEEVIKPLLLFFVALVAALFIVVYVPAISLFLPELLGLL